MNFFEIAQARQSCRNFDETKQVEENKLKAVLEAARLAPSARNSQPYHFTVCRGETAKQVAKATMGLGMNKFAIKVPVMIVITQEEYSGVDALGAKIKRTDYREVDIGIATAYMTAEATCQGLSTCIIGWMDNKKIKEICNLEDDVKLVIALGYASEDDKLRDKKRKSYDELVTEM